MSRLHAAAPREQAVRAALTAGATVVVARQGFGIKVRLEAGRVIYEELEPGGLLKPISALDWLLLDRET